MQRGFFDVLPAELGPLGPDRAVDVLRQMIRAETINLGVPITATNTPFAIMTADGGIDADVTAQKIEAGNGLIFAPRTSYQVKTGEFSVAPGQNTQIEALLLRPEAIDRRIKEKVKPGLAYFKPEDLSPRVKACLDAGGMFVTLLFGDDNVDKVDNATENAIREFLTRIDPKYEHARVEIWRQSKICDLLSRFPAVSLMVKGLGGLPIFRHEDWANRPDMMSNFVAAPDQERMIETVRKALRDDSAGSVHVRMLGEPGIGKTRLALEALRADDLQALVLYADKASRALDGAVVAAIMSAKGARLILVVDECGPEARSDLVKIFSALGAAVKVVSIYQDRDDADNAGEYRLVDVPALPDPKIIEILKQYEVDEPLASGWASLCEGSPRVAQVIGQNLRDYPADPLRTDGTNQIWVRYLAADVDQAGPEYRDRHLVMSSLALFKRFGWGAPVRANAMEVYNLIIRPLNPGISIAQFTDIIDRMVGRRVLQGDNFLYITPKALHIKLWMDWWSKYGAAIDVSALIPQLSASMRLWFGEMIEYAHASPVSKEVVKDLLGPKGLYADAEWLNTKEGGRFFFSLSQAAPTEAVALLERTLGQMSREDLLKFADGRRDILWALEHLAVYSEFFWSAAQLLLQLADAENETWANNATGMFAGLFSLGSGDVAPTSVAPKDRLPVLMDAIEQSEARAAIALRAFDEALSVNSISRLSHDEQFRLRQPVTRWSPKTYGEWWDAFALYWNTLRLSLNGLEPKLRDRAGNILVSHAREMLAVEVLRKDVIDTLEELGQLKNFDNRVVIAEIERILNYDGEGLPKEIVDRLNRLLDSQIGDSFGSQLRRYAGMDLLHDKYDRNGGNTNKTAPILEQLARQSLAEPALLDSELGWLVTSEAKNGYQFGEMLGRLDEKKKAWPLIKKALASAGENGVDYFVGGYLTAVFGCSRSEWEHMIAELATDQHFWKYVPGVVWRSGMSEEIAKLLLDMAKQQMFEPSALGLFSMGRTSSTISDETFAAWLEFLMALDTFKGAATSINLASMSLLGERKLSPEQLRKLITQKQLFHADARPNTMLSHYWLQLARTLVKIEPESEVLVLKTLLENYGNSDSVTANLGPDGDRFVDGLVANRPVETWQIVAPLLGPPIDTRAFSLSRWLRGDLGFNGRDPGPMRHIPADLIWAWVNGDTERRASYVASMLPKDFTKETWAASLVRDLLVKFGDRPKVRSAVYGNFFSGGWSGPASAHYEDQRQMLLLIKQTEKNPNVLRWVDEALKATEENIKSAKITEEARGY